MWEVSDKMMADEPTVLAQGLNSLTDSRLFLQIKLSKWFLQPDAIREPFYFKPFHSDLKNMYS